MENKNADLEAKFKNKEIWGGDNLTIIFYIWIVLNLIVYRMTDIECLFEEITFTNEDAWAMAGIQVTIALLSTTGFEIMSEDFMKRVVGVSYKQILFHHNLFKVNALDCISILAISIITCIWGLFLICLAKYIALVRMGKMLIVLSLIFAIVFAIWLFYFVMLAKYKTSVIYYKIYKAVESGNEAIVKKVDKFIEMREKKKKKDKQPEEEQIEEEPTEEEKKAERMYREEIAAIIELRRRQKNK